MRRLVLIGAGVLLATGSCAMSGVPPVNAPATPTVPALPVPGPVVPAAPPARVSDFHLSGEPRQGGVILGRAPASTTSLQFNGAPLPMDNAGRFLIAFDRDAGNTATLRAVLADGHMVERTLTVAPGHWRIEQVDASPIGAAATTAEFKARRAGELAQIDAARRINAVSDGWRQRFIWPVKARISGLFGAQRIYRGTPGSYHSGVDLAGGAGTPFVAPADGVVILAASQPFTLEGNLLMIDHGMGLNSAFLHCARLDVKEGDVVHQGQMLGAIGMTGRATGPHLHWGMKWNAARIDPMLLAGDMSD